MTGLQYLKTIITYVCANGDINKNILTNNPPFSEFDWIETFGSDVNAIRDFGS